MSQAIKDKLIEIGIILDLQAGRIARLEARLEALDSETTGPQPVPEVRDPKQSWITKPLM